MAQDWDFEDLFLIRRAIARIGEADWMRWWDSNALNDAGDIAIPRLFRRTPQLTAAHMAIIGARARHDGAVPREPLVHLFNLGEELGGAFCGSKHSASEKSIWARVSSTLHLWWALGGRCRRSTFVTDPHDSVLSEARGPRLPLTGGTHRGASTGITPTGKTATEMAVEERVAWPSGDAARQLDRWLELVPHCGRELGSVPLDPLVDQLGDTQGRIVRHRCKIPISAVARGLSYGLEAEIGRPQKIRAMPTRAVNRVASLSLK